MPATAAEKRATELFKIGEVARRTGVTLRTVRYYRSLGLIQAAHRTSGGLHLYPAEACDRIHFIRDLRSLDVPLSRIRALLHERQTARTGAEAARDVTAALALGLAEAEKRVQQYLAVRGELAAALEVLETCRQCSARPSRDVCCTCENLTGRERVPAYIRAWVN